MSVYRLLEDAIDGRLQGLSKMRAQTALRELEKTLGEPVSVSQVIGVADRVTVPGDAVPWVIFGRWMDGTVDIIREGALNAQFEILTGWKFGEDRRTFDEQVLLEYEAAGHTSALKKGKEAKKTAPLENQGGSNVVPLRRGPTRR